MANNKSTLNSIKSEMEVSQNTSISRVDTNYAKGGRAMLNISKDFKWNFNPSSNSVPH